MGDLSSPLFEKTGEGMFGEEVALPIFSVNATSQANDIWLEGQVLLWNEIAIELEQQ